MVFHSLTYIIFLAAVVAIYARLPRKGQNLFLLAASYVFYGWVHPWWVAIIVAGSLTDYASGRGIARQPASRRRWLALSLTVNFLMLGTFKYFDFFSANVAAVLHGFGLEVSPWVLGLMLPAGLSFHTFQSVSYVVDVYRGQVEARRSLPDYLLFVSFFPQMVAGPIERAGRMLPQVEQPRTMDARIIRGALLLMCWGYFKKLVIADNSAVVANKVFALHEPSFPVLWAGVFAYAVQIYADFSAYTDIARGSARLLGFELCRNFNHPYLADSPGDFWRRWHISLSTWFRDYVYIPLGGNRHGLSRQVRSILITFFLSGLWHGASWNFVIWGLWHGLLVVAWMMWERAPAAFRPGRLPRWVRVLLTFTLVCAGWLMFRERSLPHLAAGLVRSPFAATGMEWRIGVELLTTTAIFGLPLLLHAGLDAWLTRKHATAAELHYPGWRWTFLMTALASLLFLGLVLLRSPESADFIYFQF